MISIVICENYEVRFAVLVLLHFNWKFGNRNMTDVSVTVRAYKYVINEMEKDFHF